MKKIKLIVSDLHLGLGKVLDDGRINLLEEFYFDEKFVEFLHYYTSSKYEEYEIELILNGDILNMIQVDYRGHYLTVITENVSLEKCQRIVKGHPKFFQALKKFAESPKRSITYIVGNHDQGVLWPSVRAYLNETVGTDIRYKNIVYFFDGVHIEHGHMHEAANRINPKKFFLKKNVAEPILNLPFGSYFFLELVMKIKQEYPHIDKIRPFDRMIRWALFNETRKTLRWIFGLFKYFLKSLLNKDPRRQWPLQRIAKVFIESTVFPDLGDAAKKILADPKVHTVVFGHSHVYQYRQWGENSEYFNTGTWTDLTSLDISSLGKITKLTYVLLEYSEENSTPVGRLKEWHGYHRIEEDVAIS